MHMHEKLVCVKSEETEWWKIQGKGSRKEGNKHGRVISARSTSRGQSKAWEEQVRHIIGEEKMHLS